MKKYDLPPGWTPWKRLSGIPLGTFFVIATDAKGVVGVFNFDGVTEFPTDIRIFTELPL